MAVVRHTLPYDVVEAARRRLVNVFSNGVKVYLSISGGKDSIALSHLVYSLIREGKIDPKLLHVLFIDEEAVFDEVERITREWRKRFISVGASFTWYCIEVKHYSCFNMLENDESFICWDSTARDRWVRQMPSFAVTDHPQLRRRHDTYQDFCIRTFRDGLIVTGVRVAESVQRLVNFSQKGDRLSASQVQPIYDWKDTDIWRYISEHDLDFPETYLHLYQVGLSRREMRISQFFSIDTAKSLVRMSEHEPGLMERVVRREPNAYLAALYWDTELFGSAGKEDRALGVDASGEGTWKERTLALYRDPETWKKPGFRGIYANFRRLINRKAFYMQDEEWRTAYSILIAGDPKGRSIRALYIKLSKDSAGGPYAVN